MAEENGRPNLNLCCIFTYSIQHRFRFGLPFSSAISITLEHTNRFQLNKTKNTTFTIIIRDKEVCFGTFKVFFLLRYNFIKVGGFTIISAQVGYFLFLQDMDRG